MLRYGVASFLCNCINFYFLFYFFLFKFGSLLWPRVILYNVVSEQSSKLQTKMEDSFGGMFKLNGSNYSIWNQI